MISSLFRYLNALAIVLFVAGCASMPDRAPPDRLAGIKRVGVVSLVAHEFGRQYTGFTVFGNERESQDISSWGVDEEYEAQMQAALARAGRFEAVRVPVDRKALRGVYELSGADKWALRQVNLSGIEDQLKAIAGKNNLDAVVLVVRRSSGDFLSGSNQQLRGLGFYARGFGERTTVSVLHLLATVILVDGRTGQPIANKILSSNHDGWAGTVNRASPMDKVAPELARTKLDAGAAAARDDVRKRVIELPRNAWEPTFKALFAPG